MDDERMTPEERARYYKAKFTILDDYMTRINRELENAGVPRTIDGTTPIKPHMRVRMLAQRTFEAERQLASAGSGDNEPTPEQSGVSS